MVQPLSEAELIERQELMRYRNDPNAQVASEMREEKVNNILQQINPDNLLDDVEHRIRGEKKNRLTGEWIPSSKTSIPEELVSDFMSFLGSFLNNNVTMSNFSSGEINNMMKTIIDWVIDHLTTKAEDYGIEGNYTEFDRIGHIVCANCFAVLKRALNGQESRRVFKIVNLHQTEDSNKKKGGFMENLKFW